MSHDCSWTSWCCCCIPLVSTPVKTENQFILCWNLKGCFKELGTAFLHITTTDESWVFHYKPTIKHKTTNGKHPVLWPSKKEKQEKIWKRGDKLLHQLMQPVPINYSVTFQWQQTKLYRYLVHNVATFQMKKPEKYYNNACLFSFQFLWETGIRIVLHPS